MYLLLLNLVVKHFLGEITKNTMINRFATFVTKFFKNIIYYVALSGSKIFLLVYAMGQLFNYIKNEI